MTKRRYLNEDVFWALTPEAQAAMDMMAEQNIDRDLALELLVRMWPEQSIWALDSEPGKDMNMDNKDSNNGRLA